MTQGLLADPEARNFYFGERYGQGKSDTARVAALRELEDIGVVDEKEGSDRASRR